MKEVIKDRQGLYRQEFEHDNCGIGAVVNIKGKKSHDTVANALRIVENLDHRAGKDAEGKTGDGVGILLQISHKFFKKACKKVCPFGFHGFCLTIICIVNRYIFIIYPVEIISRRRDNRLFVCKQT